MTERRTSPPGRAGNPSAVRGEPRRPSSGVTLLRALTRALSRALARFLAGALALSLLVAAAFPSGAPGGPRAVEAAGEAAAIRTGFLTWSGPHGDVRSEYPRIVGGVEALAAEALNARFLRDARAFLEQGKRELADRDPDVAKALPAGTRGSWVRGYEVRRNREGLLSLLFVSSEYAPGAAHPSPGLFAGTYDLRTGGALPIGAILRPGSGWERVVDREVRRQFRGMRGKTLLGGFPPVRAYSDNFLLIDRPGRGILFFWPPYAFTPYCDGTSEFFLPLGRFPPAMRARRL